MCALVFTFLLVLRLGAIASRRGSAVDLGRLTLGLVVFSGGVLIVARQVSDGFIVATLVSVVVLTAITPNKPSATCNERHNPSA